MDPKEYLEQIGRLSRKIYAMKLRSEEYDRLALSVPGPTYDKIMVQGTRNLDAPFIKWLNKKHDLDLEIDKLEKELKNLQAEALLKIEELTNEDYKNVLVMRYIKMMSWEEICKKLFVSKRTVMRWHREGLELIKV